MCAKDDLIRRKSLLQLAGELATAESVTAKDSNHVDTFSSDFAFSFTNILSLITFIISYRLFADKLNIQQSLLDRATVVLIIILVDKTQLSLILGDRLTPSTLLARFIPTTKIRNLLLKTNYEEQVLLTGVKKNRYCTRCTKHYNFNIYVSLATDTLHLLLKGLVIKMLDFMQDMLDNIYPSTIVSLLFISKAPFALHFICAVCDLVTLAQYKKALERMNVFKEEFQVYQRTLEEEKNFNYSKYICTRANSEAHYITIVKQFYSITNKKEKHIAYIGAFSKVLLFNNNRQINNTTRMLSTLQAFKFYDLSTIICLVHLVLRDLPDLITYTTMSYYVNNYIN
ncbi:hypothetical protein HBI63_124310 [Parastagonospora nodorum]|nr:hypothetical protein HBI63_124310 [Parastagonospora nodorum]